MTRIFSLIPLALIAFVFAFPVLPAHADLSINVNRGVSEPIPIAVADFVSADPGGSEFATGIPSVITNNLVGTGLFRAIDKQAFIQDSASMQQQIRFPEWKAINAQALVTGVVTKTPDGRTRVEFRLFDVFRRPANDGNGLHDDAAKLAPHCPHHF